MQSSSTQGDALIIHAAHQAEETHKLAMATRNQASVMARQLDLQREIATRDGGGVVMEVDGIAIYRDGKKVFADIVLRNDGKKRAKNIQMGAKMEFGDSAPVPLIEDFTRACSSRRVQKNCRPKQVGMFLQSSQSLSPQKKLREKNFSSCGRYGIRLTEEQIFLILSANTFPPKML